MTLRVERVDVAADTTDPVDPRFIAVFEPPSPVGPAPLFRSELRTSGRSREPKPALPSETKPQIDPIYPMPDIPRCSVAAAWRHDFDEDPQRCPPLERTRTANDTTHTRCSEPHDVAAARNERAPNKAFAEAVPGSPRARPRQPKPPRRPARQSRSVPDAPKVCFRHPAETGEAWHIRIRTGARSPRRRHPPRPEPEGDRPA